MSLIANLQSHNNGTYAMQMPAATRATLLNERSERYGRIRTAASLAGFCGFLIYSPAWRRENFRYLTGATPRASAGWVYLPLTGFATAFVLTPEDAIAVRNVGLIDDVRQIKLSEVDPVADRISGDARGDTIGVVGAEFVPDIIWSRLQMLLPNCRMVNASALLDRVRLIKSEWELQQLRHAGRICDAAWAAFVEACKPGAREFEIVAEVEANLRRLGATDNFMLIASGGDEVRGMTPPSDRCLQIGDMIRTELTPQWNGYWTQICRTAVLGAPTDKQRQSFELFDEAVAAGLEVIRPGVTAHEIALAENNVFRKYGLGEYCTSEHTRVRGHCLGLHFDEVPILEGVHTILEKNAVLIVHPNTYTPLAGYHVLGDPVVITEKGAEKLIATPREFNIAPA